MMQNKKPVVLFYGDSRAADWPFPDLPEVQFVDRGMPGEGTAGSLHRFRYAVQPDKPDIVVLQLGINDLVNIAYVPIERNAIVSRCQTNIKTLVGQISALPAIVILSTIFPPAPAGFDMWGSGLDNIVPDVIQVNSFLQQQAGEQVILFDAFAILSAQNLLKPAYAADILHVNRIGYGVLNEALTPILSGLLNKT